MSDLPDVCKPSNTRLFADDSLLFRTINSQQDGILLQQDLDALEMWEWTWQMSFNATPSNKKRVIQTSYHIHGHNLETEASSKYLGVTLDNRLNWDQHINNADMKGNRTLGLLRRNLKECTTQGCNIYNNCAPCYGICIFSMGSLSSEAHQGPQTDAV